MKKATRLILAGVITLILVAVAFYFLLPAINVCNQEFWTFLTFTAILYGGVYLVLGLKDNLGDLKGFNVGKVELKRLGMGKVIIALALIPVCVLIIGNVISSTFFNAQKYSAIINVEEAVFETDMPESSIVSNIALMDSDSANIIGNRTLGALSDDVSQYQVNGTYYQINYKHTPKKLSNLAD